LAGLPADEPVFVLRGQDELAPDVVEFWADIAESKGVTSSKVAQARQWAEMMREWQPRKLPD
jgi:hypothetical protein